MNVFIVLLLQLVVDVSHISNTLLRILGTGGKSLYFSMWMFDAGLDGTPLSCNPLHLEIQVLQVSRKRCSRASQPIQNARDMASTGRSKTWSRARIQLLRYFILPGWTESGQVAGPIACCSGK